LGSSASRATAIALQPDGKILLVGVCFSDGTNDFCLARLHSDGTLDTGFDGPTGIGNGKFALPIGSSGDAPTAMSIQPDGRIVVSGSCPSNFCIARLNGGSYGAKNCSPDYDGDGKVLGSTDALILTRVALGMTGSAVVGGITFAPHASRQSWTSIRNYLVSQCGMSIVP
jgi:uncharacterized delta-60 repeat protein